MPASGLPSTSKNILNSAKGTLGAVEKAVIEICDLSEEKAKENPSAKPSGGIGGANSDLGSFDSKMLQSFRKSLGGGDGAAADMAAYEGGKKFRFQVQFNPEELSFSGYGGEEMAIQDFDPADRGKPKPKPNEQSDDPNADPAAKKKGPVGSSHMGDAQTRIEMSVRLIFDKTDVNEAFYSDKFYMNSSKVIGAVTNAAKKAGDYDDTTVQTEIEALTAVVRDSKKRLAKFVWGDMAYEGTINNVSAEYVMFNINGEPCRAYATINMVLYDANEMGPDIDIWRRELETDFGSKAGVTASASGMNVVI